MGNLTNVMLVILALSVASYMVLGTESSNVLIKFVMDPSSGVTLAQVLTTLAWASATAFVTTAIATFFFKNETILWAGVFGALAQMMINPMLDLFNIIAPMNRVIAMLVVAPLYLYVIFTMINWLRAPR